jgi:hypothetical protein
MSAAKRILDERPRIGSPLEARALVDAVLEALAALSHLVGEETELIRGGRLPEAMTREPRKTELAGIYMRGVEQVKLNAVALARFAPEQVKRLKAAHADFQGLIETNQLVLATARAVSESIVRDLATDANKPSRVAGYGPAATVGAGTFARPNAGPLVVSRSL